MDKFIINGGKRISGSVDISGAKNAVLPLMTAALLVDGETTINSVPDLRDTRTMIRLLKIIGAEVAFKNNSLAKQIFDVLISVNYRVADCENQLALIL